jgi:cephalosporin hydroxylase
VTSQPPDHPESDRIEIDLRTRRVVVQRGAVCNELDLGDPEAFSALSVAWLMSGWYAKYSYGFSWLGRPIIQLPEDIVRLQELLWQVAPDVIVETGVAHGGSLVLSASVCAVRGRGRVIGVDVEIKPDNRAAIEAHPLARLIHLVEGDSIAPATVAAVRALVGPGESALLVLDSAHGREHVRAELEAYAPLVTPGSFIVVFDGVMGLVAGGPRAPAAWATDNPSVAAAEFVAAHASVFELVDPPFPFDEGTVRGRVTYAPGGLIRRKG